MTSARTARFCRFTLLLAAIPALLGGDGGCVYTQHPVEGENGQFVDHYLVGDWYAIDIAEDLSVEVHDRLYSISYAGSGELEIQSFMDSDEWLVHRGTSTRLGVDKYISLRLHDCADCDDGELDDMAPQACPYLIYRYQTWLPKPLAADIAEKFGPRSDELIGWIQERRGNLLFTAVLNAPFFAEAIENDVLDGEEFDGSSVCLAENARALQTFLTENEPDALVGWEIVIRR